jgi:hypothetical protein
MMGKAQLSTEVVILLAALLIVLMTILSAFSNSPERSFLNRRSISAREYSEKLAFGINNIFLAGDGASQSLAIPTTLIDGTNYSISIIPAKRLVEIRWQSKQDLMQYSNQLITSKIGGKTTGIIGMANLTNLNGTVIIQN